MGVPRGWWAEGKGDTRVARWSGIELKKSMFKEEEKRWGVKLMEKEGYL